MNEIKIQILRGKNLLILIIVLISFLSIFSSKVLAVDAPTYRGTIRVSGDEHYASFNDTGRFGLDPDGNMYVVEELGPKVYKFGSNGDFVEQWGEKGTGDGEFQYATAVSVSDNYVFVLDRDVDKVRGATITSQIQSFSQDGTFLARWNTVGDGRYYYHLATQGDYVFSVGYNTTTSKPKVEKFDYLGNLQTAFDVPTYTSSIYGISVESTGTIDLMDSGNIRRYTQEGVLISTITGVGTVRNVVEDSSGNFYVFKGGTEVRKYDSSWAYIGLWASGQFSSGQDINISSDGYIYVLDGLSKPDSCSYDCLELQIRKFSLDGTTVIDVWRSAGTGNGQFYYPEDIAVDSNGNRYVLDHFNNRVQVFNENNEYVNQWTLSSLSSGYYYYNQGIAIDSNDNIYIVVQYDDSVYKYSTNGTLLQTISQFSDLSGSLYSPNRVAVDSSDNFFVSDSYGVQMFDSTGEFKGTISYSYTPMGLAFDSSDNLYVSDDNDAISKYTKTGVFSYIIDTSNNWSGVTFDNSTYGSNADIAIDSSDNIYILDSNIKKVKMFDTSGNLQAEFGSWGMDNSHFNLPRGLTVDGHDTVYIADSKNHRIQYYSYSEITTFGSGTDNAEPGNNNDSNQNTGISNAGPNSCGDTYPTGTPDLFQINTSLGKVKLFFSPVMDKTTYYYIAYGQSSSSEGYGVSFEQGYSPGVLSFEIDCLNPEITYYFKVRSGNGCATGKWSNVVSVRAKGNSIVYKNTKMPHVVLGSSSVNLDMPKVQIQDVDTQPPTSPTPIINSNTTKKHFCIWKICF